jgi:hypothetical protein
MFSPFLTSGPNEETAISPWFGAGSVLILIHFLGDPGNPSLLILPLNLGYAVSPLPKRAKNALFLVYLSCLQFYPARPAESARAVTGQRCPHSGVGKDFLPRRTGSFLTPNHVPAKTWQCCPKRKEPFPKWLTSINFCGCWIVRNRFCARFSLFGKTEKGPFFRNSDPDQLRSCFGWFFGGPENFVDLRPKLRVLV